MSPVISNVEHLHTSKMLNDRKHMDISDHARFHLSKNRNDKPYLTDTVHDKHCLSSREEIKWGEH